MHKIFGIMENLELKEQLRKIAGKDGASLTAEERQVVRDACKQLGVELKNNGRCKDCYIDAAVGCYRVIEANEPTPETERKYVLRKGVDVYFAGMRVNETTLTDDFARGLIQLGFDKKWFAKCE